jgi:hypothetical protein
LPQPDPSLGGAPVVRLDKTTDEERCRHFWWSRIDKRLYIRETDREEKQKEHRRNMIRPPLFRVNFYVKRVRGTPMMKPTGRHSSQFLLLF